MLDFLQKNIIGKTVDICFCKEDEETAIGFVRNLKVNSIEKSDLNSRLFIINKDIYIYISDYKIHNEYPHILMIYDDGVSYIEISKEDEEPWKEITN